MSLENQLAAHTEQDERRFDRLEQRLEDQDERRNDRFDMMEDKFDELSDMVQERFKTVDTALAHQKGFIGGVVWVITALFAAAVAAVQYFNR